MYRTECTHIRRKEHVTCTGTIKLTVSMQGLFVYFQMTVVYVVITLILGQLMAFHFKWYL